jgi:hypothetical protein
MTHDLGTDGRREITDEFFAARIINLSTFRQSDLTDLLSGTIAAIMICKFLPAALCRNAVSRLNDGDLALDTYDPRRVNPPIARFGPVINDFNRGGHLRSEYWARASIDSARWQAAMDGCDPVASSISTLTGSWGSPVLPARIDGRPLFAGAVREINEGALVHFDDVRREFGPNLFDEGTPVVQLAFNAWISVPAMGGKTRIWRRQWNPTDSVLRDGYGYDVKSVVGKQMIELSPALGDAIIFSPRNFHSVSPSECGRRIAVTFFMSLSCCGDLVIWSLALLAGWRRCGYRRTG